jgi:hypothetical protein
LKKECEVEESENSCKDNGEKRLLDLANSKSIIKLIESGGKTRGVKKISVSSDLCMKKIKETTKFLCKKG